MTGELDFVLDAFKNGSECSTSQIIEHMYYNEIKDYNLLDQNEKKELKLRLHRKGIYHINKLVEQGILQVTKYGSKGEKHYQLGNYRNTIIKFPQKHIEISKNPFEIKGFEIEKDKGILFEQKPFGIMLNAAIINSNNLQSLSQILSILKESYKEINDVIAIANCEKILSQSSMTELQNFFSSINSMLRGERKLSLIIDLDNPYSTDIIKICHLLAGENSESTDLIFLLMEDDLIGKTKILSNILDIVQEAKIKFNVSQKPLISFSGKCGAYLTTIPKNTIQPITTNTVAIDLARIKQHKLTASQITDLFKRIFKSMHYININQKMDHENLFPTINSLQGDVEIANNCIRVWNYDWKQDEYLFQLLEEISQDMKEFTKTQENIYKSCGFPITFNIKLGSAYNSFNDKLSPRQYEKSMVNNFEGLKHLAQTYLKIRLKYDGLFNQGDRVRVFRNQGNSKEMLREIHYLLTRDIKFFTYDFRSIKKIINLRDFM